MTSISILEIPSHIKETLIEASLDTLEDLLLYTPPSLVDRIPSTRFKRHQPRKGINVIRYDRLLTLTPQEITLAYDEACAHVFLGGIAYGTALNLLQEEFFLSLGDPLLDAALGGPGIMTRGITEVAGESSVGKTQLCLQLCLMVQLPYELGGLDGSAVWLSTEGKFPYTRLESMIGYFVARHKEVLPEMSVEELRDNVYFESMADQETQMHIINYQLPILIHDSHVSANKEAEEATQITATQQTQHDPVTNEGDDTEDRHPSLRRKAVKLVIVDSITNNFRSELTIPLNDGTAEGQRPQQSSGFRSSILQRSTDLCEIGLRLRTLADNYGLAVICVNQVTDVFGPEESELSVFNTLDDPTKRKKPALGHVWESMINARVILQRSRRLEYAEDESTVYPSSSSVIREPHRTMSVVFSPWAPSIKNAGAGSTGKCRFKIDSTGVVGLPERM
ncbi:DNA repair protein xrcc3 [Lobosporangium transversale]|uniref:p-loop containing nucleoside triphosphate hydrolase protein n=1 Tax=Lobosporangium transversale TaxID=64571 RepID=A0A1Y2GAM4_9FUNG|nr:P-loop containing nucleoside triphosphate hydrolase protein [Lobosporangium transversale]KAF9919215.1 DNA repair protein xrcc3 [Lobosporangium transversale]ORZ05690.1 P-loop containing nucleoside triphosphate hydrolase protein [Lobosporangium transversale]|eukprot:XP_021877177.1 P-loop containing nucleoside triphosphate hydrolase protein [Lobosporangium transversale]